MYKGCAEGDYPKVTTVTLDYPQEYLTSIFGYMRDGAIQSLTFDSNKGRSVWSLWREDGETLSVSIEWKQNHWLLWNTGPQQRDSQIHRTVCGAHTAHVFFQNRWTLWRLWCD